MQIDVRKTPDLKHRWEKLDLKKSSLIRLCEEYSQWTLPYVFPRLNVENVELQIAKDSIGAQAVNHLSNKLISVLFPPQHLFFRLSPGAKVREQITAALSAMAQGVAEDDVNAQVSKALLQVEQRLASIEKQALEKMDMVAYRPAAVNAAKLLIITGNAMMYHPPDSPAIVYNVRNFCVVRDASGQVIEGMTKECKAFETFSPDVQAQIRTSKNKDGKDYGDYDMVDIYTQFRLGDDGRFHVYQQADQVLLDTSGAFYTKDKLPWIVLTWNLIHGEDYGRGLVADFAGAFHAINVLSASLQNLAGIMGDIKFFVDPQSMIDVPLLNASPPGSYHAGRPDQVGTAQINKGADAQFIAGMIERYERQIAQAFLLHSQLTRDAERVTAEEIRRDADELETSNGGVYSRQANTWQRPTAFILLDQIEFDGMEYGIVPQIITGMDSLSRASELDNLRMFFADFGMLQAVPEDVRAVFDYPSLAKVFGTARSVDYQQFTKTNEQLAQEARAREEQVNRTMQRDASMEAQVAASKEAAKTL